MSHINKIEGIGVSHTKKLEAEGIKTAEQLLQAGSSRSTAWNWRRKPDLPSTTF